MFRIYKPVSVVLVLGMLVLAGCGSSSSAATKTIASTPFKIVADDGGPLSPRYTCDGANVAPPLEWGAVPAGTASLAMFIVGFKPELSTHTYEASVEWAVAGVNPAPHHLSAGQLPPGSYQGLTSTGKPGYSLCPEKGSSEQYQFELYGLPATDVISHHFSGLEILGLLESTKSTPATVRGAFAVTYARR